MIFVKGRQSWNQRIKLNNSEEESFEMVKVCSMCFKELVSRKNNKVVIQYFKRSKDSFSQLFFRDSVNAPCDNKNTIRKLSFIHWEVRYGKCYHEQSGYIYD